jgi:hypothetical protein
MLVRFKDAGDLTAILFMPIIDFSVARLRNAGQVQGFASHVQYLSIEKATGHRNI